MLKNKDKNGVAGITTTTSQSTNSADRRKTLKNLGIGGALITGAKWASPVVVSVSLPAHAQASGTTTVPPACTDLTIELNWELNFSAANVDLDLEVLTPGGSYIAPKSVNGTTMGQCLQHGGDEVGGAPRGRTVPGSETISCGNVVTPGHYTVFVRLANRPFRDRDHLLDIANQGRSNLSVAVEGCGITETISGAISLLNYPDPDVIDIFKFDVPG